MAEKLCTIDAWRSWYYRDRLTRFVNDTFSRVRGQSNQAVEIVRRGSWSKSNIFAICENCGRVSIYGICPSCDFVTVCCVCQRLRMPDGSWLKIIYPGTINVSHTYCEECVEKEYPGLIKRRN